MPQGHHKKKKNAYVYNIKVVIPWVGCSEIKFSLFIQRLVLEPDETTQTTNRLILPRTHCSRITALHFDFVNLWPTPYLGTFSPFPPTLPMRPYLGTFASLPCSQMLILTQVTSATSPYTTYYRPNAGEPEPSLSAPGHLLVNKPTWSLNAPDSLALFTSAPNRQPFLIPTISSAIPSMDHIKLNSLCPV